MIKKNEGVNSTTACEALSHILILGAERSVFFILGAISVNFFLNIGVRGSCHFSTKSPTRVLAGSHYS